MISPAQRRFYALAAAYYPALTLLLLALLWALGKPSEAGAVVGFALATALAGALVARALRSQIITAKGSRVALVAIMALSLGTPIVVIPEALFGFSGLHGPLGAQDAVLSVLVLTLVVSFSPPFWAASIGWVLLLRREAHRAGHAPAPATYPPPEAGEAPSGPPLT